MARSASRLAPARLARFSHCPAMVHTDSRQAAFGPYVLLEQIGQGGMAQVWRARRAGVPTPLVVKTLHPHLATTPLFVDLFISEARITAQLSHPGIVRLYDYGVARGVPYLAMEQVDGCTLAALCRALPSGGRLALGVSVAIVRELCHALGHGHDWHGSDGLHHPIVHGDVSPSNVMVRRDGGVTLIDFGVAHMGRQTPPDRARLVIGKCGYLAPELLDGAAADERADVFSVGVVLHELLTGRRLFLGKNSHETMRLTTEAPIPRPSRLNPSVPPELDGLVLRALERKPSGRFASATEMALALGALYGQARCARSRVAAAVAQAGRAPDDPEPVTAPIAPALPRAAAQAIDIEARLFEEAGEDTATVCERRSAAPERDRTARPVRRRSRHVLPLVAALAALVITFFLPPSALRFPERLRVDRPARVAPAGAVFTNPSVPRDDLDGHARPRRGVGAPPRRSALAATRELPHRSRARHHARSRART